MAERKTPRKNSPRLCPAFFLFFASLLGGAFFIEVHAASSATPASDTLTLTNVSGSAQTNYPLRFARPFAQGEIAHFPQVVVNGTALPTQANVKQRYPDESAKHALLSVILPTLPAGGKLTISFRDQSSGNNTPLSKNEMLGSNFNFEALMELTKDGLTRTVSAREMLQNGNYTSWASGPIAQTVILADHSAARKYDLGWDSLRSVRPMYEVTFWPRINKVAVRFIGENANTKTLQDVQYDLKLKTGLNAENTVYAQNAVKHFLATRWTKVFWIGGAPEHKVNIDHNIAYLAETKFIPNYDRSLKFPEGATAVTYKLWQNASKNAVGDPGLWMINMGVAGGRGDIGPMPSWTAGWLYSGDWRDKEVALGNADLAGSWPLQLREGDPTKYLDKSKKVPALGKPISVYGRPSLWLFDNRIRAADADNVVINGARILGPNSAVFNGWAPDLAHQPDAFYPQYILTGENFYLEQMQLWTASTALIQCPGTTNEFYCRGPAGAGIQDQPRGDAWALRNRVNAAFATPDNDPQKKVLIDMIEDALAFWEGQRDIGGTTLKNNPNWQFGYKTAITVTNRTYGYSRWGAAGISPLHFWEGGGTAFDNVNSTTTGVNSPWMQNFVILELGRAAELGFPAQALFEWLGSNLIGQLTDPGYNPYLVAAYRMPVTKTGYVNFNTWAEVMTGYDNLHQNLSNWPPEAHFPCGSCTTFMARAALALAATLPGGDAAWKKLNTLIGNHPSDPQWAIVPRATNTSPPLNPNPRNSPRALIPREP
jgi:hypothetical protein